MHTEVHSQGCQLNQNLVFFHKTASHSDGKDVMNQRDSELLRRVGKFMVVLQETYNLQWRCEKLVKNLVHQIHGCRSMWYMYHEDNYFEEGSGSAPISPSEEDGISRLGMEIEAEMNPEASLFENDHNLIPIAESICQLLSILINIDSVVANNAELLEAWDLYKSVVAGKDIMANDANSKFTPSPVEVINVQQSEYLTPEALCPDDSIESDSANGGPSKQQLIKLEGAKFSEGSMEYNIVLSCMAGEIQRE
eukprot:887644_1